MYKIIGNDGKNYGPTSAEEIRAWIAQGRVESRTPVLPVGATEWTILGLLPEFAPYFSGPPPIIAPPRKAATTSNGFATAGFVCGIISCLCCCGCPFNLLGLTFSIIALVQIHRQTEKQNGWGLALAGLICSAVSLLVTLGLGVIQLASNPATLGWRYGAI